MRVITGTARGRKMKTLDGLDTRPTTDRIKESIFNIVQFDVEGRRVLDLFAGSGQMAIEAVSRGAASAVAIDCAAAAISVIRENVKTCNFQDQIRVMQADFKSFLKSDPGKFDLIFLDPPYKGEMINNALDLIAQIDILSEGGIIVCETDISSDVLRMEDSSYSYREYKYGRIKLTIVRKV